MKREELLKKAREITHEHSSIITDKVNGYDDYGIFSGIAHEVVNLYKECISYQSAKIFDSINKLMEHLKSNKMSYVGLKENTIRFYSNIDLPSNRKYFYIEICSDDYSDYIIIRDSKDKYMELHRSKIDFGSMWMKYKVEFLLPSRMMYIDYIFGHLLFLTSESWIESN